MKSQWEKEGQEQPSGSGVGVGCCRPCLTGPPPLVPPQPPLRSLLTFLPTYVSAGFPPSSSSGARGPSSLQSCHPQS